MKNIPYMYVINMVVSNCKEAQELKRILSSTYIIRVRYTPKWNGSVYINEVRRMYRPNKFKPIVFENCTLIEGTPLPVGGSNVHPYPTFEEGYCILEMECKGFPYIDEYSNLELLSISLKK